MGTPWTIPALARFFRMLDDADCHDGFWWRANEAQYEPFKILINCNDLFYWACADCEEVTPDNLDVLEGALADIRPFYEAWRAWKGPPNEGPQLVMYSTALLLFCCRVRKMRPQGAYYDAFPPGVDDLFDAAGPEREAPGGAFGNTTRRKWNRSSFGFEPTTEGPPWRCPSCRVTPHDPQRRGDMGTRSKSAEAWNVTSRRLRAASTSDAEVPIQSRAEELFEAAIAYADACDEADASEDGRLELVRDAKRVLLQSALEVVRCARGIAKDEVYGRINGRRSPQATDVSNEAKEK